MVKHRYDAWGKCAIDASTTNTELANINPFRYRSYYYDEEIELYYLPSRHYDAHVGRFITADSVYDAEILVFGNIHYYCNNDPINNVDSSGNFAMVDIFSCGKTIEKQKPKVGDLCKYAIGC